MKKKIAFIILITTIGNILNAQTQINIEECQQKARNNYPLIKQYGLIEKSKEYTLSNANKGYLPQLSISAKATYQSDVTKIPIAIPNMKTLQKDQYGATIDLSQTIWDGGIISSQKDMAETSANVSKHQLDVDMYSLNERVNQLYFGILLLEAQENQNKLYQEELQRNHNTISSYIENGVANQSDLDIIKVEQVKSLQTETALISGRKTYLGMLELLIGENLSKDIKLLMPTYIEPFSLVNINRSELNMFEAQLENLEVQRKQIKASYMPKLGLFATGGYGRPGLNMLSTSFDTYYIAGINISWNFSSLYTQKNSKQLINTQQLSVKNNRETFLFNTNLDISKEQNEIQKQRDLLKHDDEIILLRNRIKKAAEVKHANGTMTITDLMREITAEDLSKQDKILHEMELLQSIYNLKNTTNN